MTWDAEAIKLLRRRLRMTQAEFARAYDVPLRTLARYESEGVPERPSTEIIGALELAQATADDQEQPRIETDAAKRVAIQDIVNALNDLPLGDLRNIRMMVKRIQARELARQFPEEAAVGASAAMASPDAGGFSPEVADVLKKLQEVVASAIQRPQPAATGA